jgi:hypothetical protein
MSQDVPYVVDMLYMLSSRDVVHVLTPSLALILVTLCPWCADIMYRGTPTDEEGELAMRALFPSDGGAFLDVGTVDTDMVDVEFSGKCAC